MRRYALRAIVVFLKLNCAMARALVSELPCEQRLSLTNWHKYASHLWITLEYCLAAGPKERALLLENDVELVYAVTLRLSDRASMTSIVTCQLNGDRKAS